LVLRGSLGLGPGIGVILTDLPSLTSLSTSIMSGEAGLLTCLDTRLRALGVVEGEAETEVTDEVTFLETVAGDEDSLAAFLTGGVLVTEAGSGTFFILAAEEEAAFCPDLMDGEDEEVVIEVILAAEEEAPTVCLDFMDEDPSISKLMSSREMVSLLRMMLDFALDWTLDLR